MLKLLARVLKGTFGIMSRTRRSSADEDEIAPIYESLAMTDELREALFPKTPQMVSAIFDRPAPLDRRRGAATPVAAPAQYAGTSGRAFPIIF